MMKHPSTALALLLPLAACAVVPNTAPPATVAPSASSNAPPPRTDLPLAGNPAIDGIILPTTRPIAATVASAPSLSTLMAAVKAAGLEAQLFEPGPYTLFAPTNDAFGRLAPGTVDKLLAPENRAALATFLRYHLVPGTLTTADLLRRIAAGGGTTTLTTVSGQPLTVSATGTILTLTSATGNRSYIETADVRQSNGIVHVVNGVLVPVLG